MKISDALAILNLEPGASLDDVKLARNAALKKYHPDINPAGLEMMKLINAAWDTLKQGKTTPRGNEQPQADYGDQLNDALNAIIDFEGLEIEICGSWIWVSGDTRTHKDQLKAAGFKYASKKKMWNYRPAGWRSVSRGRVPMEAIREKYGSYKPQRTAWSQINANE